MAQAGLLSPMRLKGLGEVSGQLTGGRVDFFGQQADVVEVGDGTLEDVPRPRGLAGQGQGLGLGLDQPEGTQHQGALPAFQAVGSAAGVIPVDQAAFVGKALGDGVDGGQHACVPAPWPGQMPLARDHGAADPLTAAPGDRCHLVVAGGTSTQKVAVVADG